MSIATTLREIKVVDSDSHVAEPPDLWTSRVASKWRDSVPRVDISPSTGLPTWHVQNLWLTGEAFFAFAGWKEPPPGGPETLEEADRGTWDPAVRLERMDEYGLYAQILYPNIIAFNSGVFMGMDPELGVECTRAYNDFLLDFASADRQRLIPVAMLPFWDRDASVAEMKRCKDLGMNAVLFANRYELVGLPPFYDRYWDPLLAAAQDLDMSLNFHVGFGTSPKPSDTTSDLSAEEQHQRRAAEMREDDAAASDFYRGFVKYVAMSMMGSNADSIGSILTSGVCDRFPTVKWVSVESGMGYVPFLLESLDWHWKVFGMQGTSKLLPSEYFARQCYGTFWFEVGTLELLSQYPDNFMFSTDYPHQTSMSPGVPGSPAEFAKDHIAQHFGALPLEIAEKALWKNAATIYQLS